ncbi:NDP-sugar epimerase [Pseudomonas syringae pv. actinidiae]|uniref:NDP-sugar epimerase n=1 Tax=Pseudomonas syringae pv. actinidiae TaxID=103796 RepID=A0AAN4TM94_PSESF|nr:NDP-sugar epimerase [Pseudomonas syringae pv. actinidiae]
MMTWHRQRCFLVLGSNGTVVVDRHRPRQVNGTCGVLLSRIKIYWRLIPASYFKIISAVLRRSG